MLKKKFMNTLIKINKFSLFKNDKQYELNGEIFENSFNIIGGPSGVGKSSFLLKLIGCNIQSDGELLIYSKIEKKFITPNLNFARKNISYLQQSNTFSSFDIDSLIKKYEDIKEFDILNNLLFPKKELNDIRYKNLKGAKGISGGQLKRLGLLIVLLTKKKIILLDECDSGISKIAWFEIFTYLLEIEATFILASHNLDYYSNNNKIAKYLFQ